MSLRTHYPVRRTTLDRQGLERDMRDLSPSERVAMVWTLSVQAWQFKEPLAMNSDFADMLSALSAAGVERKDFITNKRAAGRPKDQADLALLAEAEENRDERGGQSD